MINTAFQSLWLCELISLSLSMDDGWMIQFKNVLNTLAFLFIANYRLASSR